MCSNLLFGKNIDSCEGSEKIIGKRSISVEESEKLVFGTKIFGKF
jgi:hypothetical protein